MIFNINHAGQLLLSTRCMVATHQETPGLLNRDQTIKLSVKSVHLIR